MAIPDHEYFTFDDCCMEVYARHGIEGDTLSQLLSDADSYGGIWDSRFVGSKDTLMCLRNFTKVSLSCDTTRLDYDINGGMQSANITSNYLQLYFDTPSSDWCHISPSSSTAGNLTIEITCDYNYDGVDRSTMVYIKDHLDNIITAIYIYQTAY